MNTIRDRAALALDLTHAVGERGPRTFMARERVAAWLDGATRTEPAADVNWLLRMAANEAARLAVESR